MLQLFPNRSRRDLKLKVNMTWPILCEDALFEITFLRLQFKKEERQNMALINKALLHPKEFNIEELQLQFDKEERDKEAKKAEWSELSQKISRERK